jgi:hypothetical protein
MNDTNCAISISICILCFMLAGCREVNDQGRLAGSSDEKLRHFTLLSWKSSSGHWYYSLREGYKINIKVKADSAARVSNLKELKTRLTELPRGAHVNWSKYRAIGFDYPPPDTIEEVQRFAKNLDIYLYANFVREE